MPSDMGPGPNLDIFITLSKDTQSNSGDKMYGPADLSVFNTKETPAGLQVFFCLFPSCNVFVKCFFSFILFLHFILSSKPSLKLDTGGLNLKVPKFTEML